MTARRFAADAFGILVILALTVVGAWDDFRRGGILVRLDLTTFFAPTYGFLGERLRAGDIPFWNPSMFAGAPFAADPESGWLYLPAMVLFAMLPVVAATQAFVAFHLALSGLAAYALGRGLGMPVAGALVAGVAYEFSAVFDRARCCPVYAEVSAWLPLTLFGLERALRAGSWKSRVGWWAGAGFALSQVLAAWLGQGAYYALLVLGGYAAYRTLLDPLVAAPGIRARIVAFVLHGGAVVAIGFGLAAAAILPRLEFIERSTLAGGIYQGDAAAAAVSGGWTTMQMAEHLLGSDPFRGWYVGGATLALAFIAPLVAGRRYAVPYFGLLSLGSVVLTARAVDETPLNTILYAALPRFETMHQHIPERITIVFYLGPALLAGAAVTALGRSRRSGAVAAAAALPFLGAVLLVPLLRRHGVPIANAMLDAFTAACVLAAAYALPSRWVRLLLPALLVLLVFDDLFAAGHAIVAKRAYGDELYGTEIDLADYAEPSGAAAFLLERQRVEPPFRFLSYDPHVDEHGPTRDYRHHFADPLAVALLANNRGLYFGLDDVQGYNPLQLARYREYVAALNGHPQEYHGLLVFAPGLNSPLLDLLNVRYIVVPADPPAGTSVLPALIARYPTVYIDDQVRVLENREAAPRAWIVHQARQVETGGALPALTDPGFDWRSEVLLEAPPPELGLPSDPALDRAVVDVADHDYLRLSTASEAPGLLVLSEVHDPSWKAYVDGASVPLSVADHALRAVPLPAGEHVVELRYESDAFRLGAAISLATVAAVLVALLSFVWWDRRSSGVAFGAPRRRLLPRR